MGSGLHAGLGGEVGHVFEGGDEFGAAIGVAGIVDGVYSDEDVGAFEDFGPGHGEGQENRIAGGDVGDRDAGSDVAGLGDVDVGGQGARSEGAEIDFHRPVLACAVEGSD